MTSSCSIFLVFMQLLLTSPGHLFPLLYVHVYFEWATFCHDTVLMGGLSGIYPSHLSRWSFNIYFSASTSRTQPNHWYCLPQLYNHRWKLKKKLYTDLDVQAEIGYYKPADSTLIHNTLLNNAYTPTQCHQTYCVLLYNVMMYISHTVTIHLVHSI